MVQLASELRWQDRQFRVPIEKVKLLEQWGYDAVFTAELTGSDCLTPLAFIAAHTERIKLGTRIAEVTARTPTWTAQAFQTIDRMAGGNRVMAGLGSGMPDVVEGWHGRPWGSPYQRMRDHITIMRQVFSGGSVEHQGREVSIPYRGPDARDAPGWSSLMETTADLPILVGAGGPRMLELAGELADGVMPIGFAPGMLASYTPLLEKGFARAAVPRAMADFPFWVHVDMIVDDDVRAAMRPFKEYVAYYAATLRPQMVFRGYSDLCDRLIELVAAGQITEAVDLVPDEYIDDGWLVGPVDRIVKRFTEDWAGCGATGIILRYGSQVGGGDVLAGGAAAQEENLEVFRAIARSLGTPGSG
jgi:alkanesulfonate monooxygenase SsuD/methylene tetrahydromethanopterin reductase-like flavin-dependent oxidoreductase (luciferase family)